jgi:4-amino-4-deoxy-L-arabinose transferase-like glycosyltransferase
MTKKPKKTAAQPKTSRPAKVKASGIGPDRQPGTADERGWPLQLGGRRLPVAAVLGLILGGSLLLGLIALHEWRSTPFFNFPEVDERIFVDWSLRIVEGEWIGKDVFYFDPLYPYLLALSFKVFGYNLFIIRLFQVMLGTGSIGLVYIAARHLLGERGGLLAALFLALYGPLYFFELLILKENMVIFLAAAVCALGVSAADRPGGKLQWLLLGLCLALITLLRGNVLALLPLAVLGAFWFDRQASRLSRLLRVLFLIAGMGLVLFPVALRNYLRGGEFVLTTSQAGTNFFIGNNEDASGGLVPPPFVRSMPMFMASDFKAEAEKRAGRSLSPGEVSRFWFGEGFRWMRSHPGQAFRLTLHKARMMIHNFSIRDNYSFGVIRDLFVPSLWVAFLGFGLLWGLALLGLFEIGRRHDRRAWLPTLFAVVYPCTIIPFFIVERYRTPVVPAMAIFAAAGLTALARNLRAMRLKAVVPELAFLAVTLGLSFMPIKELKESHWSDYVNIAVAYNYSARGDPETALLLYDYVLAIVKKQELRDMIKNKRDELNQALVLQTEARATQDPRRLAQLGRQLGEKHLFRLAIEVYERAVALHPDLVEAHRGLGNIFCDPDYPEFRDIDRGIANLSAILKHNPNDAEAMNAIGSCYIRKLDPAEAKEWVEKALAADPNNQAAKEQLEQLRQPWR